MNLDPNLSNPIAIAMSLLAAFMWGTWFISLKYLGNYPLEAFYLTLFSTSFVFVWVMGFLLDGSALIANLQQVWLEDQSRVLITFLCGLLYVAGMMFSIVVMKEIGLSLAQPLQASINLIVGTLISAVIGGIPTGLTPLRISFAALFLILAILLTMLAGKYASSASAALSGSGEKARSGSIAKVALLLVIGALFVPAYSTGLSYGLKTVTQPHGLAVMPFMAVLASGAFVYALVVSSILLTRKKAWHVFRENGFKIHKLGILSGLAHYGGNIIHTFATCSLSATVSWPLGITAGLWTQLWGLAYGEFKGAPKKAYLTLFAGLICYLLGAFIIASVV